MASLPNTFQSLRQPLASRLKNALDVYGHITPPSEEDDSDCTRFIGRCLVELNEEQRRCNERLFDIEHRRESPYDGPTFSSQNDKIDGIWQEIGELKSKVDNIEDKVQNIEDAVAQVKEDIQEIDSKIDDSEACLIRGIEQLEKNVDGRFSDLETKVDSLETKVDSLETKVDSLETKVDSLETKVDSLETKVDSLETKFDKVMFEQEVWSLRQRNGLADRPWQPVQPVGMSYIDADGKPVLKVPTWPVRSAGYYWKMHNQENHKKLIEAHHFYKLNFRHWALGDDGSNDSYVTDDLDLPLRTLEQAVAAYPDRAVMALFNELGLVYSKFQEQFERQQLRPSVLQKRSPKDTSSKSERRVKRSSDGSTVDLIPVSASPTASADNEAMMDQ
jgi:outer membrane murein-binding lipoprotein Lpp